MSSDTSYKVSSYQTTVSYHSSVPQVEGVPAEALWEAVGFLSNVVFVRFNGAVWGHCLPWKKEKQFDTKNRNFYSLWVLSWKTVRLCHT